jgi:hypothetical protein
MAGWSDMGALVCSVAMLALGVGYWVVPNDLIPDSEPWGHADDVGVLALAVAASWALRLDGGSRVFSTIPVLPGRNRTTPPRRSVLVSGFRPGLQMRDAPAAAQGAGRPQGSSRVAGRDRRVGTLYGRIFLDICTSHRGGWELSSRGGMASFAKFFFKPWFRVAYAFAAEGRGRDMDAIVEQAVLDTGADPPRIMKLYAGLPDDSERKRRGHMAQIAGKTYFILPSFGSFRDRIHLGDCYEGFLARLGGHSRRNLRNVHRDADKGGITHSMIQARDWPDGALLALAGRSHPVRYRTGIVTAIHRLVAEQDRGFHSVLRLSSGDVLSCCTGFIEGNTAFIIHQMNHRDHLRNNPSLTNRAFMIEQLIAEGVRDLVFIKGCRGILQHACEQESGATIWVIQRSFGSVLCGLMLLTQFPVSDLPGKVEAFFAHLRRAPARRDQMQDGGPEAPDAAGLHVSHGTQAEPPGGRQNRDS